MPAARRAPRRSSRSPGLDAVYHDTADLRLLDQGITVRRRTGEGTRWTVKFPTAEVAAAGGLARREVDVDCRRRSSRRPTVIELVAPLPRGRARWRRSPVWCRSASGCALVAPDGSTLAEVDDDRVSARAMVAADDRRPSGAEVSFREIEVEFGADAAGRADRGGRRAVPRAAGARAVRRHPEGRAGPGPAGAALT